ncbi:MAG: hypothetical protein GXP45_06820 [bacterium]|nr:hypothetical protein [bacterium]
MNVILFIISSMVLYKDTILSNELEHYIGQEKTIRGWLHTSRIISAQLAFLIVRDRHGFSQAVLEDPEEIKKLEGKMIGTILSAKGKIAQMPKGKFKFELQKASIEIINEVPHPSPIDISKNTINADHDTIHENKVIALRHPSQSKIFKVAAIAEKHMRAFFDQNDFTQINSPKILAFPTEG